MRKNIVLLSGILFMIMIGLQAAEPVAAAKLVDHGAIKGTDADYGYYKVSWFTYQTGVNYVKVNVFDYWAFCDDTNKMTMTLKKVSKKKIKLTMYDSDTKSSFTTYGNTKLTAAQYYWRVIRPSMF
jgi:hypothetical protein